MSPRSLGQNENRNRNYVSAKFDRNRKCVSAKFGGKRKYVQLVVIHAAKKSQTGAIDKVSPVKY